MFKKYFQKKNSIAQCYFQLADVNNDGRLSVEEVLELLKRLHLNIDKRTIRDMIKRIEEIGSDDKRDNHLDREEFLHFVRILWHCKEIENIYEGAKGGNEFLDTNNFRAFLSTHQKQFLQLDEVAKMMEKYEMSVSLRGSEQLGYEGFRSFLMSEENCLIDPVTSNIYQDMTQPLTSYWIFSSHNTYLVGNQLTGDSSTNGYTSALTRGCRCVEIDAWDGDDGEPKVTHGRTLTSDLSFRTVIEAIDKVAFYTSPYPVIVSIENHCSVNQQRRMAAHMKQVFGEKLQTSLHDPEDPSVMLSPEKLKYKFLIKGKVLKRSDSIKPSVSDDDQEMTSLRSPPPQPLAEPKEVKSSKIAPELSDIVAIPSASMPKLDHSVQCTFPFIFYFYFF